MHAHLNSLPLRAAAIAFSLAATFVLVLAAGWWRLQDTAGDGRIERHRPVERVAALDRLSKAIVPADAAGQEPAACAELDNVRRAIDARLNELARPTPTRPPVISARYVFDPGRWGDNAGDCRTIAQDIEEVVKRSWPLLLAADTWRENAGNRSVRFWQDRQWRPRLADIETPNGWALIPGCVRAPGGMPVGGVCDNREVGMLAEHVGDPLLAAGMIPPLREAISTATGDRTRFRGKSVPVGADVALSLDPKWQSRAAALVRCFTGTVEFCKGVLPRHLENDWRFQPGRFRTAAAGVVITRVRTGEVVAAAGAISDCARANLGRKADPVRDGAGRVRMPLFRPDESELCAQVPDSHGAAGFLTRSPVFWLVGPGSTSKTVALLAGIEGGVVPPSLDATYRRMLASSHDPDGHGQRVPQRIARRAAPHFQALLRELGFEGDSADVLFGGRDEGGWRHTTRSGFVAERFNIDEATFEAIHQAKRDGRNADAIFGSRQVAEYLKAHRLGISAIGSGDVRHSAWGLSDWGRRLALRAEGAASMLPSRMATVGRASDLEPVPLNFAKPESVRRLLAMLGGATSSRLGGTAAGSCRIAFGSCPPDGHPDIIFGKTGTAETGPGGQASPWIKTGGAGTPPGKLFFMVVRAADGELFSVGTVSLRIREKPGSPLPELHSNASAELSMLAVAPFLKSAH